MLIDLQRALQQALASESPVETLRAAALGPEDRALADGIPADNLILAGLLVRKLRFERLCQGDERIEAWFDRDPAGFTEVFNAYHRAVPPREFFPQPEARAFREYLSSKNDRHF